MRKKKFQEGLIDKTEGQLENIEQMVCFSLFTYPESFGRHIDMDTKNCNSLYCFPYTLQVHDLEYTQIESQVLEGLKKGNESLKKMHELVSLEDVEKIMDETSDAVEYQRQISDLLTGGLSESDESEVHMYMDIIKRCVDDF